MKSQLEVECLLPRQFVREMNGASLESWGQMFPREWEERKGTMANFTVALWMHSNIVASPSLVLSFITHLLSFYSLPPFPIRDQCYNGVSYRAEAMTCLGKEFE